MPCLICGKANANYDTLRMVENMKLKNPKIDREIDRIFSSDPNRVIQLMDKQKKLDKDIRRLEMKSKLDDEDQLLCNKCLENIIKKLKESLKGNTVLKNNESEYSQTKEMLMIYKICCLMIKETLDILYKNIKHPIKNIVLENFTQDGNLDIKIIELMNNLDENFYETANNIKEYMNSYDSYEEREFYEAKLLYILGYNKEALLHFQKLLNEHEQKDEEAYMREYVEENNHESYINSRNEWRNNILEIIYEIKEKIGIE